MPITVKGEQFNFDDLKVYIPEEHSPKVYVSMIKHLMGVDGSRNPRPGEDMLIFLVTCKRTGLDPLAKQIYPVYRWSTRESKEVMSIQAGIDGLRAVAERSGTYGGSDEAFFEYAADDQNMEHPLKATITGHKLIDGKVINVTASARWSEYAQKGKNKQTGSEYYMGLWASMPHNQLAKCAEALMLRKGWPNELSGLYAKEEMDQADRVELPAPKPKAEEAVVVAPAPTVKASEARQEAE